MRNDFDIETMRAMALAIHQEKPFFVVDGTVYGGNKTDERAAYREWLEHSGIEGTDELWCSWCEEQALSLTVDDDYLVLTDDEANEKCEEYIRESLWAFNASFIADHCSVMLNDEATKSLQKLQSELCENANELIFCLIGGDDGIGEFIADAVSADGRGHFLSMYDGHEHEINLFDYTGNNSDTLYVYRIN